MAPHHLPGQRSRSPAATWCTRGTTRCARSRARTPARWPRPVSSGRLPTDLARWAAFLAARPGGARPGPSPRWRPGGHHRPGPLERRARARAAAVARRRAGLRGPHRLDARLPGRAARCTGRAGPAWSPSPTRTACAAARSASLALARARDRAGRRAGSRPQPVAARPQRRPGRRRPALRPLVVDGERVRVRAGTPTARRAGAYPAAAGGRAGLLPPEEGDRWRGTAGESTARRSVLRGDDRAVTARTSPPSSSPATPTGAVTRGRRPTRRPRPPRRSPAGRQGR